mgnify:CR=1 FL=1
MIKDFFNHYRDGFIKVLVEIDPGQVEKLFDALKETYDANGKVIIFGNGGSAANASHLANDLNKTPLNSLGVRALSLTDNVPWITAIGNDFGYEFIFVNQLERLLEINDLVIAISSSGNSENVIKAVEYANSKGNKTIGILGFGGGKLKDKVNLPVLIPTLKGEYGFMEDGTTFISHAIASYLNR